MSQIWISAAGLALATVFGSLLGFIIKVLPVLLSMAGGAMLYVVSDEIIPETHAHEYEKIATYSLILGFITLLFIEMSF